MKILSTLEVIVMVKKKMSKALSAVLAVSMLTAGAIVFIQDNPTLEVAKSAGDKKVEVIKGIQSA
ncbi:hypothetical protein KZX62_08510 [Paenibacillus silvae]|nr:hypothetical protein [Paenibacillus silvae]